jgi:hypothetical protein
MFSTNMFQNEQQAVTILEAASMSKACKVLLLLHKASSRHRGRLPLT